MDSQVLNYQNSKNRLAWIDNVKMVAMVFVIFGHTWRIIHYPLPEWMGLFILSFNMALFVIMTGYTSSHSIEKIATIQDLKDYIEKITKRILLPSIVFYSLLALFVFFEKIILCEVVSWKLGLLMLAILIVYVTFFFIGIRYMAEICLNSSVF